MRIERVELRDIRNLFLDYHGYKSIGGSATYAFGVIEPRGIVAAYIWQPPPFGCAKSVCPEAPGAVLSLSRMVAVPRSERALKHVSKPLRWQMKWGLDRGRFPALVTFSDASLGHTGYVYACSGWEQTTKTINPFYLDSEGRRVSRYSNGRTSTRGLILGGYTELTRWEHWSVPRGTAALHLAANGWTRVAIPGKVWKSGSPAFQRVKSSSKEG